MRFTCEIVPGRSVTINLTIKFERARLSGAEASRDGISFRGWLMKAPKTIRGLMLFVAIIGIALGIGKSVAPLWPLMLVATIIMSPQIIVVAICAYLSVREERKRLQRESADSMPRR
jgi:hypothetical protein